MLVIADFECVKCHNITEEMCHRKKKKSTCPECGKQSKRIISVGNRSKEFNESPTWMKSVLEVVDRENPAKHVQEFVKNPTRRNYKAWMKGEGIRPVDYTIHGAPPIFDRPQHTAHREQRTAELVKKLREMRSLTVGSR